MDTLSVIFVLFACVLVAAACGFQVSACFPFLKKQDAPLVKLRREVKDLRSAIHEKAERSRDMRSRLAIAKAKAAKAKKDAANAQVHARAKVRQTWLSYRRDITLTHGSSRSWDPATPSHNGLTSHKQPQKVAEAPREERPAEHCGEAYRQETQALRVELMRKDEELANLQGKLEEEKAVRSRLERQASYDSRRSDEDNARVDKTSRELDNLRAVFARATHQLTSSRAEADRFTIQLASSSANLAAAQAREQVLRGEVARLQGELDSQQQVLSSASSASSHKDMQIKSRDNVITNLQAKVNELRSEVKESQSVQQQSLVVRHDSVEPMETDSMGAPSLTVVKKGIPHGLNAKPWKHYTIMCKSRLKALKKQFLVCKLKASSSRSEASQSEAYVSVLQNRIKVLEEDLRASESNETTSRSKDEQSKAYIPELRDRIESLEQDLRARESDSSSSRSQIQQLESHIEELDGYNKSLEETLQDRELENASSRSEIQQLESHIVKLKGDIESLEEQNRDWAFKYSDLFNAWTALKNAKYSQSLPTHQTAVVSSIESQQASYAEKGHNSQNKTNAKKKRSAEEADLGDGHNPHSKLAKMMDRCTVLDADPVPEDHLATITAPLTTSPPSGNNVGNDVAVADIDTTERESDDVQSGLAEFEAACFTDAAKLADKKIKHLKAALEARRTGKCVTIPEPDESLQPNDVLGFWIMAECKALMAEITIHELIKEAWNKDQDEEDQSEYREEDSQTMLEDVMERKQRHPTQHPWSRQIVSAFKSGKLWKDDQTQRRSTALLFGYGAVMWTRMDLAGVQNLPDKLIL